MKGPRKRTAWVLAGLVALALATAWWRNVESPEARAVREVQRRLVAFAKAASFQEKDPPFVKLGYGQRLVSFFGPETAFDIAMGTRAALGTFTPSQLVEGAMAIRASNRGLSVEFVDVVVRATPTDAPSEATAHLTSKIYFLGDSDYSVQEFRIGLSHRTNEWKIVRIETVQTMVP